MIRSRTAAGTAATSNATNGSATPTTAWRSELPETVQQASSMTTTPGIVRRRRRKPLHPRSNQGWISQFQTLCSAVFGSTSRILKSSSFSGSSNHGGGTTTVSLKNRRGNSNSSNSTTVMQLCWTAMIAFLLVMGYFFFAPWSGSSPGSESTTTSNNHQYHHHLMGDRGGVGRGLQHDQQQHQKQQQHTTAFPRHVTRQQQQQQHGRHTAATPTKGRKLSPLALKEYSVIFFAANNNKRKKQQRQLSFQIPSKKLRTIQKEAAQEHDFGGLEIRFLEDYEERQHQRRVIYHDFLDDQKYSQLVNGENDDDNIDNYYAFDDDNKRNPLITWDDPNYVPETPLPTCRRTNWHRDLPINCNKLHEYDVQQRFLGGDTKYLGEGAYREVYLSKLPEETVVFKAYFWGSEFAAEDFEYMRMDAIVAEKLTYSDRIVDIYGFCGTGMINEAMEKGDMEIVAVPSDDGRPSEPLEDYDELDVKNELPGTQKLEYALDMAEAVLLLHGYSDGIIVHDDIQLSQFLLSDDGKLKLNDFNRAEIMLYNEDDAEYCRYRNNPGHGDWRAPEEYKDKPLNEKIDIWSLGNNFYSLLTGVYPLYVIDDVKEIQKRIMDGETGFIDDRYHERSFAESKLAEIIPQCWEYNPDDRIDIFELTNFLRDAVKQNQQRRRGSGAKPAKKQH